MPGVVRVAQILEPRPGSHWHRPSLSHDATTVALGLSQMAMMAWLRDRRASGMLTTPAPALLHGLQQGIRVGQAHILTGVGDEPAGNQPGVGTGIQQPGEPQQRGIRVRAAQGFAKGGQHVIVQRIIDLDNRLLNAVLCDGQRDVNLAALGGRAQRGQFQRVERHADIAIG